MKRTRQEEAESIVGDRPDASTAAASDEDAADEDAAGSNSDESRAGVA